MVKRHLWLLLLGLLFPLWNKEFLIGISNSMGRFVAMEDDFQHYFYQRMAKVLVELDVSHGMLMEMEIVCNDLKICQRLDFLKVP